MNNEPASIEASQHQRDVAPGPVFLTLQLPAPKDQRGVFPKFTDLQLREAQPAQMIAGSEALGTCFGQAFMAL